MTVMQRSRIGEECRRSMALLRSGLAGVDAAVDDEFGAGHEGGLVGGEEEDGAGYFAGLAEPLHGDH